MFSVALSTTEAELVALTETIKTTQWIAKVLNELYDYDPWPCIGICIDNQGTFDISHNPAQHKRTRHIDTRFFYVRDLIQQKKIALHKVDSVDNLADIFTKILPVARFKELMVEIGQDW